MLLKADCSVRMQTLSPSSVSLPVPSGLIVPERYGNETVPEVVSVSGYALLHFFSDAAYNLTGFNISYRSVCLSAYLSVCIPVCLSPYLYVSAYLFVFLSAYLSVCLHTCLSVSIPLCLCIPVCLSVCTRLSVCQHLHLDQHLLQVCLCGCLSISLSACVHLFISWRSSAALSSVGRAARQINLIAL